MNAESPQRDVSGLISIVAPACNEEGGLDQFTNCVDAVMRSSGLTYEIVFVNDGSTVKPAGLQVRSGSGAWIGLVPKQNSSGGKERLRLGKGFQCGHSGANRFARGH